VYLTLVLSHFSVLANEFLLWLRTRVARARYVAAIAPNKNASKGDILHDQALLTEFEHLENTNIAYV